MRGIAPARDALRRREHPGIGGAQGGVRRVDGRTAQDNALPHRGLPSWIFRPRPGFVILKLPVMMLKTQKETPRRRPPLRARAPPVTTHVSAWFGRDERPPTSGVSPICHRIALTCEFGHRARPNHGLKTVVTPVAFTEKCPQNRAKSTPASGRSLELRSRQRRSQWLTISTTFVLTKINDDWQPACSSCYEGFIFDRIQPAASHPTSVRVVRRVSRQVSTVEHHPRSGNSRWTTVSCDGSLATRGSAGGQGRPSRETTTDPQGTAGAIPSGDGVAVEVMPSSAPRRDSRGRWGTRRTEA
jgi:hypothetical protein